MNSAETASSCVFQRVVAMGRTCAFGEETVAALKSSGIEVRCTPPSTGSLYGAMLYSVGQQWVEPTCYLDGSAHGDSSRDSVMGADRC